MHWKHYQIIATKSESPAASPAETLSSSNLFRPWGCLPDWCMKGLTVFNDTWRLRQPSCSAAVWAAFCGPSWRSSSSSCSGSCPVCCSSSALGIFQPAAAFSCQLESRIIERTVIKQLLKLPLPSQILSLFIFYRNEKKNQFLSTFLFSWLPS